MTHSIEYVDDLNRQLKSLKKDNDELRKQLKALVFELADPNTGDMYDDALHQGMHYRVKMKIRRIIKQSYEMLNREHL